MRSKSYRHSLLVLTALAGLSLSLGRAELIVDGEVAAKGDPLAKFTVRIFTPIGLCTGTLITRRIVVTAGHCVVGEDQRLLPYADQLKISFNRFEREFLDEGSGVEIKADKIVIDGGYLDTNGRHTLNRRGIFDRKSYDIALIHLSKDAPADFAPIHIATSDEITTYAKSLRVAGYGQEGKADDALSGRLKSASVTLTQNNFFYLTVVSTYGNGITAAGDSGGPLLIEVPGEGYKLAGVHNAGTVSSVSSPRNAIAHALRLADYTSFLDQGMARLGSNSALLFSKPRSAPSRSTWPNAIPKLF